VSYYRIACGVAREPSMRALAFATVGLCVTGVGFTQTPTAVSGSAPQTFVSAHAPCLLLQNQCWGMSKIPVAACHVSLRNSKAKDACAIDGMRFISRYTVQAITWE